MSVDDYVIRLCEESVREARDLRPGAPRIELRRALETALARLDGIADDDER